MALFTRARGVALAGITSIAVAMPMMQVAPATAVSTTQAPAASTSTAASAAAAKRRAKAARFATRSRKVMRTGYALRGTPYRWGGASPRGFDCSGFTMYVYRKTGVRMTHSATAQMRKSHKISKKSARRGDLVFFRRGSRAYHVGIYAGNGRVLHSPRPGKTVRVDRIWTSKVTYGRVL